MVNLRHVCSAFMPDLIKNRIGEISQMFVFLLCICNFEVMFKFVVSWENHNFNEMLRNAKLK